MFFPQVVSRDQWLMARRELLAREEQAARDRAALVAERRRLPMVRIEKDYAFAGEHGPTGLPDLFGGRRQLIVFHLMFDPAWDAACPSCATFSDGLSAGLLAALRAKDTAFAAVSLAPLGTLTAARDWGRWPFPWYSSSGSDFNYDFHATLDERVAPVMYNFEPKEEILAAGSPDEVLDSMIPVEVAGLSCFVRDEASVFHTYSVYGADAEEAGHAKRLLELTALGGLTAP